MEYDIFCTLCMIEYDIIDIIYNIINMVNIINMINDTIQNKNSKTNPSQF